MRRPRVTALKVIEWLMQCGWKLFTWWRQSVITSVTNRLFWSQSKFYTSCLRNAWFYATFWVGALCNRVFSSVKKKSFIRLCTCSEDQETESDFYFCWVQSGGFIHFLLSYWYFPMENMATGPACLLLGTVTLEKLTCFRDENESLSKKRKKKRSWRRTDVYKYLF